MKSAKSKAGRGAVVMMGLAAFAMSAVLLIGAPSASAQTTSMSMKALTLDGKPAGGTTAAGVAKAAIGGGETLNFGSVAVGSSSELALHIDNTGFQDRLVISKLKLSDPQDFSISSSECSPEGVPAQSMCAVGISFNPKKRGTITGTLSIVANTGGAATKITLTGTGD